jgi:alkanesulfonate monooxygenase SsuD/methylene tetrahydromethanopterin reductase-like flavin-dependent oxidoreductase (luciferase family)
MWFMNKAENLYAPWQGRKVPDSYKFAVSAVQQERVGTTLAQHLESGAFAMGNPDTIIKVLKKYQEAGVDQVLCFMQMGNLAHNRIMDSIRLFGRHVIPYFN